ncbi:MAG: hypothetical protein ACRC2U_19510 [Aeromonas sp.]
MAAVITQHQEPDIQSATAYLVRVGFIYICGEWLRGQRDYARLELMPSGAVSVVEGVA